METRTNAPLVAVWSGLAAAIFCALTMSVGDGSERVAMLLRASIVLLGFSGAALALVVRPPRASLVWVLVAVLNAAALAVVLGFGHGSRGNSFQLDPFEALGIQTVLPAMAQVGALCVAAYASVRTKGDGNS